jgi:predicted TIM-barrel fold metal-dependent hydrolase
MRDLELAMERFPVERVLFGTNFPLYNYVANVEKVARGTISDAQRSAIGSGNAKRLLGIA